MCVQIIIISRLCVQKKTFVCKKSYFSFDKKENVSKNARQKKIMICKESGMVKWSLK